MRAPVALLLSIPLLLSACAVGTSLTPFPTQTPSPTAQPIPTATPTLMPTPTLTVTPPPPGYAPLQRELAAIAAANPSIDLGVAFVDLTTGEGASLRGDERFYALSTFKAPLAAYYLSLLESGQLTEQPTDAEHIAPMLARSSNEATTCIFERVGGLAGFNDWLAAQGLPRSENFIVAWEYWPCPSTGYVPQADQRYSLQQCPGPDVRCDKAFAPDDLAGFYQRLHAGQVISPANLERWLVWMQKPPEDTAFDDALPPGAFTAYTKEGFRRVDSFFGQNFYHETGIVSTPTGDYVLLVFMQNNPEWPGHALIGQLAAAAHQAYEANRP